MSLRLSDDMRAQLIEATIRAQDAAKTPKELFSNLKEVFEHILGVDFLQFHIFLKYNEEVRNTHGAPRSGVRNFKVEKDKPFGYSGYTGSFYFRTVDENFDVSMMRKEKWPKDCNAASDIHFGSGAMSGTAGSYNLYFFLDDFPKMKTELNRGKLYGKPTSSMDINIDLVCAG